MIFEESTLYLAVARKKRGYGLKARLISNAKCVSLDEIAVRLTLRVPRNAFQPVQFEITGEVTEAAAIQAVLERQLQGFHIEVRKRQ